MTKQFATAESYIKEHLGYSLSNSIETNAVNLLRVAEEKPKLICPYLYNAVAGLSGNSYLVPIVDYWYMGYLSRAASQAAERATSPTTKRALCALKLSSDLYSGRLLSVGNGHESTYGLLRKSEWARCGYPDFAPPHSLYRYKKDIIELQTWVSEEDAERLYDRYPVLRYSKTPISFTRSQKTIEIFGEKRLVSKTLFGEGGFGVVRLGRHANSDHFMAVKKIRAVNGYVPAPIESTRIGLTGRLDPRIAYVFVWGQKWTRRSTWNATQETEGYVCISEFGLTDLERPTEALTALRWLFQNRSGKLNDARLEFLNRLVSNLKERSRSSSASSTETLQAKFLRELEPFANSLTRYRYINELSYQIILAINALHSHNWCHQDIKPSNLIFAHKSDHMAVKVIDLEMCKKYKPGSAGEGYYVSTYGYRPPINEADLKKRDQFALGMTLRQVAGESFFELTRARDPKTGKFEWVNTPGAIHLKSNLAQSIIKEDRHNFIHPWHVARAFNFYDQDTCSWYSIKEAINATPFVSYRRVSKERFLSMSLALIKFSCLFDKSAERLFKQKAAEEFGVSTDDCNLVPKIRAAELNYLRKSGVTKMPVEAFREAEREHRWSVESMLGQGTDSDRSESSSHHIPETFMGPAVRLQEVEAA